MPLPNRRVDVVVLPVDPDEARAPDRLDALALDAGWWRRDLSAGPRADALVPGGFVRVRWDVWSHPRLVANGLGGFAVSCPQCATSLVRVFTEARRRYDDEGATRTLTCPSCGWTGDLDAVDLRPPGGFARVALHLRDVASVALDPEALVRIQQVWGSVRLVLRRPG